MAILPKPKGSVMLNLTQHTATPEQVAQGVKDVPQHLQARLKAGLTFDNLPTREQINEQARAIARMAWELWEEDVLTPKAMIGGAPFFMAALERELKAVGFTPYYAFSVRDSVERVQEDGTVVKVAGFKHVGFVEVA
jgi:hypothetical protein